MRAGRKKNADERKPIGNSLNLAFVFRRRPVLQQRGNWHDKKTTSETEQREQHERTADGNGWQREQRSTNGQAKRAEWHKAVFDFSARQITCRQTAETDAERERDIEQANVHFVHAQRLRAVKKQIEQQQHSEKAEVGIAKQHEPERTVAAHETNLLPDFARKIGVEFFLRIRRRNFGDAEARNKSGNRERDKNNT